MENEHFESAENAGSSQTSGADNAQTVPKDMYTQLESKLGKQGQELGEYRELFKNIEPILDKLDQSPELARAIVDGKIDQDLVSAISEGRITISDAEMATTAQKNVQQKLGKEAGNKTASEITDLVAKEMDKLRKETDSKIAQDRELRDFEAKIDNFIKNTPDFEDHAKSIQEWLEKHPNVEDVTIAYYAVKGELSEKEAKKAAEVDATERAKEIALMAAGGASASTHAVSNDDLFDMLIQGDTSPNRLF